MRTKTTLLAGLFGIAACAAAIPNGDFEETSADGTVAGWTAPAQGAWCAAEGVGRSGTLALTGGGDQRWRSAPVAVGSDRRYAFVFSAKGPASGTLTSGAGCANVDLPAPGAAWQTYTNVFRTATRAGATAYPETFHLGEWKMNGRVLFDAVRLVPVTPRWRTFPGGVELGAGESVEGNAYSFGSQFDGPARNDARPLVVNRSGFNSTRWCLGPGSEVVYRHAVAGRRFLEARLAVTCGYYAGGSASVEVSTNGVDWTALVALTNSGTPVVSVPRDLFPAAAVWVRFRGGAKCALQIPDYAFDATFDGTPLTALGGSDYVEEGTGRVVASVTPSPFHDAGYGACVPGGSGAATLWTASSGWKIPKTRTAPTARAAGVALATAANEAEAVQFVVRPARACADVRVAATDLRDDAGRALPASAVEILRVGYVRVEKPTDRMGCRGFWPDPLPPQDDAAFPVPARENQPFWVRVKPPKGTPAGHYRGALVTTLRQTDGTVHRLSTPFAVEVFGFDLPDTMTVETAFGFNAGTVARYHGLKTAAQRDRVNAAYLKALGDHHLSPYNPVPGVNWSVTWTDQDDIQAAQPVFDWTRWDAAMEKAFATYHFNTFRIHIDGLGGGTFESRRAPSFRGFPADNPAYDILMGRYLRGIEDHLRAKGWLDKAFVYWFDEPEPKDYPFVMQGFRTLTRHAPGLRRMLTEEPCTELLGGPNVWCPLTPNLHADGEAAARARGDTFWWYVCCGPKAPYATEFIDHPGSELRVWLWQTWAARVTGILIWETVWWTSPHAYPDPARPQNPYEDAMSWATSGALAPGAKSAWGNGDGRFLYPPRGAARPSPTPVLEGPVESLRLEMLRDGIEDYEYFALLRRLLKAKGPRLSEADRARYEALLAVPRDVSRSMTDFTLAPEPMERHRRALARAIVELLKGEKGTP